MRYLLDTDTCIWYLKGRKEKIRDGIGRVGMASCCISEVTKIELLYGCELSMRQGYPNEVNAVNSFLDVIEVVPIASAIKTFTGEKARLRLSGNLIPDFDLLIACTAKACNMVLVSGNIQHLSRVDGITIEDWSK